MNIFEAYAPKYYESGYNVIPVSGKRAFIKGWSSLNSKRIDESMLEDWITQYGACNIGLLPGPASQLCTTDYDYTGEGCRELETAIRSVLPQSPVGRFGSKGFGLLYRYSGLQSRKIKHNKSVILEFFSDSGQIVIPPSIHPVTKKPYEWVGYSILDYDVELLPCLTDEILDKVELVVDDFFKFKSEIKTKPGRSDSIVGYGFTCVEDCKDLGEFADKLWEYDQNNFGNNSYFNDKEERGNKDAKAFCEYKAKSIIKTLKKIKGDRGETWRFGEEKREEVVGTKAVETDKLVEIEKVDKPDKDDERNDFEKFKDFYRRHWFFKSFKLCYLHQDYFLKYRGEWEPVLNNLGVIKSLATDWHIHTDIEPHLTRCLRELKPSLLIDIPKWDGRCRIDEMLSFVKVKNVSHECFVALQKDWMAGIFRRLKNNEEQNRVNLWEGAQNKGKDTFFMNMLRGFGRYKIELNGDAKLTDIYASCATAMVVSLPEYDQFKGISSAGIKDLVTSPGKHFRSPYERKARYWPFRYSMYSTANVRDYLTDPTGNRRFWIFEIDSINWDYPKFSGESDQLVAEILHLFETGFKATSAFIDEVSRFVEENRTPVSMLDLALEEFDSMLKERLKNIDNFNLIPEEKYTLPRLMAVHLSEDIRRIAFNYGIKSKTLQVALNNTGRQKRVKEGRYYDASSINPTPDI